MADQNKWTREKELAFLCSYINGMNVLVGSIFRTFDKSFEIAERFIDKYPLETSWGENKLEYDETIEQFVTQYIKQEIKEPQ